MPQNLHFSRDLLPHIYVAGTTILEPDLCRNRRTPFSVYSYQLRAGHCNSYGFQVIKGVRAGQGALLDIFERIEMFFGRLEVYIAMPPTTLVEMMDIIIQIIVEVFSVLAIATNEIRQSRIGKYSLYKWLQLIERCLEKYARNILKNLIGIGGTEIDDALKTLDKLTQKESWTIITQNLKAILVVDETLNTVKDIAVATATDVDQMKRLSSNVISAYYRPHPSFQGTSCAKAFTDGSPHRIPRRTITLHAVLITRSSLLGSLEAPSFRNGSRQVPFFGYTENVCPVPSPT